MIITDASTVRISAILLQQPSDSSYRIIAYSSRTLTPTEQNYSQLERECLAILHACETFRVYLLGKHFEIITDHKPLVHLFNNAQSQMPLWIERWSLRLQEFDFTISHIKGTVNPADFLSRHPFDIKTKTDNITEQYVSFVQNNVCPETISLQDIRDKTKNDITLQKVISKMQNKKKERNIENKELKILLNLIPELTLTPDGILLKRNWIIIPNELQHRVTELAHENHLGTAKTIALLREQIYFVNMEAKVKGKISECILCAAVSKRPTPQPLEPSTLPPYPWHTINIDFLGPLPNQSTC